ncbi:hypothetical protein K1719_035996 [Acacia pycnantha]|nr:hypothetical protein K1719_035996 [Acacia pycnantha]
MLMNTSLRITLHYTVKRPSPRFQPKVSHENTFTRELPCMSANTQTVERDMLMNTSLRITLHPVKRLGIVLLLLFLDHFLFHGLLPRFQPKVSHENTFTRELPCMSANTQTVERDTLMNTSLRITLHYTVKRIDTFISGWHYTVTNGHSHDLSAWTSLFLQNGSGDLYGTKYNTPPSEKPTKATKPSGSAYAFASSDRPFVCPYEGCEKAYIHEYKLKLHLKRAHPGHGDENVAENAQANNNNADNEMDEASDADAYGGKKSNGRIQKPMKEENYEEEDSEETEEDRDNVEDGWRYGGNNEDDDEETEYED